MTFYSNVTGCTGTPVYVTKYTPPVENNCTVTRNLVGYLYASCLGGNFTSRTCNVNNCSLCQSIIGPYPPGVCTFVPQLNMYGLFNCNDNANFQNFDAGFGGFTRERYENFLCSGSYSQRDKYYSTVCYPTIAGIGPYEKYVCRNGQGYLIDYLDPNCTMPIVTNVQPPQQGLNICAGWQTQISERIVECVSKGNLIEFSWWLLIILFLFSI